MKLNHTPGPWNYVDNGFDGYIMAEDGTIVCGGEPHEGRMEDDADTRLIAAAPEMLAELIEIVDGNCNEPCNLVCGEYCSLYNAKKIIESATGRPIEEVLK